LQIVLQDTGKYNIGVYCIYKLSIQYIFFNLIFLLFPIQIIEKSIWIATQQVGHHMHMTSDVNPFGDATTHA